MSEKTRVDFLYQSRPMKVYPVLASELEEIRQLASGLFGSRRIRKIVERIELDSRDARGGSASE
jgi:hypothetical protein